MVETVARDVGNKGATAWKGYAEIRAKIYNSVVSFQVFWIPFFNDSYPMSFCFVINQAQIL